MDKILETMNDSDFDVYAVPKKTSYIMSKAELKQSLSESGMTDEQISKFLSELRPTCVISKKQLELLRETQDPLIWKKIQEEASALQIVNRPEREHVLRKVK